MGIPRTPKLIKFNKTAVAQPIAQKITEKFDEKIIVASEYWGIASEWIFYAYRRLSRSNLIGQKK